MKPLTVKSLIFVLLIVVMLQACGTPVGIKPAVEPVGLPVIQLPLVEAPVIEPGVVPVSSVPAALPLEISGHAVDQISAPDRPISGGDRFTYGQFERPFNSETMDIYFPNLDIVDTVVLLDDTWVYGVVQLSELDASPARYALEIDFDRDGHGDFLVTASTPSSTDWSVTGVQIYADENNDVGNASPMFTDEGAAGDGFEVIVFDQGAGADTESAAARISPENPNVVEFAVKRAVIGSPQSFMINMWAGHSLLDPALFDLNDLFTHEEAGAANPGLELFYPIKAVSEIDNSCRLAIGFQPSGSEPGLCKSLVKANPSDPYNPYTAPVSCEPCNVGATSQKPYPDCSCTYPVIQ